MLELKDMFVCQWSVQFHAKTGCWVAVAPDGEKFWYATENEAKMKVCIAMNNEEIDDE